MLPPFIVEEIRRREREDREQSEQIEQNLHLPLPVRPSRPSSDEPPARGVVVIDLAGR